MIISLVFHSYSPKDDLTGYVIRGATVSEVEIDVLTGEKLVGEELETKKIKSLSVKE
jgi:hypothetical protein